MHGVRPEAAVVARLGQVLGHETCVRLIDELTAGEASVSDLCARLELDQPRVSSHLALLREAGLVSVESHGRQRRYSLNGHAPALALATLRTLAAGVAPGAAAIGREVREDAPLRRARTCYDHLAGVAGVRLLDAFRDRGWLAERGEREFDLTGPGEAALAREGVDVAAARRARRTFAIRCADWTERGVHLGGALGSATLAALLRSGRARLEPGSRAVALGEVPWLA
jgi:DNA-binding transcriptional ArsR family regulator